MFLQMPLLPPHRWGRAELCRLFVQFLDQCLAHGSGRDPGFARFHDVRGSEAAVEHVIGSRVLTTIANVKDDHVMTFGDTGYVLYQSQRIPKFSVNRLLMVQSSW